MKDKRIVYGAGCTWWDSIDKVATLDNGLPCCPYCSSVLFEMSNIEEWDKNVLSYEQDGNPGYRKMIEWMRGKCFPNMIEAQSTYNKEQK